MFCPNCGEQIPDRSIKCPQCGEVVEETTTIKGGAVRGFFLLIASFFTMPLRTLKLTIVQLKEIGSKGKLEVEATDVPHLTWLGVAGNLLVSIIIVWIVIGSVIMGLTNFLRQLEYSVISAIGGLFGMPIVGILVAIAVDWLMMISLELLSLWVGIANNIKRIAKE